MILDVGSLMFNMNLNKDGGNPSWGTDMGQGTDYKFCFENQELFLEGMLYNSVSDIKKVTDVSCPLGKGGNQQDRYEYVMASIFNKVYCNDILISGAKFLLIIVKQIFNSSGFHIGRKTLKYNPKMTFNGDALNEDCFNKIKQTFGLNDNSAWFVNSIDIINQDELHFGFYIGDKNKELLFKDVYERKDFVNKIVNDDNLIVDYESLSKDERKLAFKNYVLDKNLTDSSANQYVSSIDEYIGKKIGNDPYLITDVKELNDIYDKIKKDPILKKDDDVNHRRYSSAIKWYREFIVSLKNKIKGRKGLENNGSIEIVPHNLVVYGTPGCGKSYYIENSVLPNELHVLSSNIIRTTFFPDYTNVDFIGQVLPKVDGTNVSYIFTPGPFTLALAKAIKTNEPVVLIIEELNRGNASSIFGDIFQLLDRTSDYSSRYEITNINIQDYLNKEFKEQGIVFNSIKIPSNLYLFATMNTSDQNVFKLDNAFKRRWEFLKMKNTFGKDHLYKDFLIPGMESDGVTWKELVLAINEYVLDQNDSFQGEDKQVGVYFVDENVLIKKGVTISSEEKSVKVKRFGDKVLEYLWDDVARYKHEAWFNDVDSLDALIDGYSKIGEQVFSKDFLDILDKYKAEEKLQINKEDNASGKEN